MRIGLGVAVTALFAVVACGNGTGTRDRIRSADEITADYKARLRAVYETGFREIVWPECEHPSRPPEAECGYLSDELLSRESIDRFRTTRCNERPEEPISDTCFERFRVDFFDRIEKRYPRAEGDAVRRQCTALATDCSKFALLEVAAMAAHNAAIRGRIRAEAEALVEQHRTEQVKRGRQVETIARARAQEAAAWQAFGAGLAGAARGASGALSSSDTSLLETPAATVCSSDYDCGFGNVCLKAELQMRGVCARAVDRSGMQTYPTPRGNFGPGERGQCSFDTECPIGFRCLKNGALTGNCVK